MEVLQTKLAYAKLVKNLLRVVHNAFTNLVIGI